MLRSEIGKLELEGTFEERENISAHIIDAEGGKVEAIKQSEATKLQQINKAEGKAQEIALLADATAAGIERIAAAIQAPRRPRSCMLTRRRAVCATAWQSC